MAYVAKDTIGSESLQTAHPAMGVIASGSRRSLGLLTQMRRQAWLAQIPLSELGRGHGLSETKTKYMKQRIKKKEKRKLSIPTSTYWK